MLDVHPHRQVGDLDLPPPTVPWTVALPGHAGHTMFAEDGEDRGRGDADLAVALQIQT